MRRILLLLVGVGVLAAGACSTGGSKGGAYSDLRVRVSALRDETKRHGAEVAASGDRGAILAIEAEHAQWTAGPMAMMSDDLGAMEQCHDHMGHMLDGSAMRASMDSMWDECEVHLAAMTSAGTVASMHSEETWHQGAMGAMLDGMDSWLDEMGPMMDSMDCSSDGMMGGGGGMGGM